MLSEVKVTKHGHNDQIRKRVKCNERVDVRPSNFVKILPLPNATHIID